MFSWGRFDKIDTDRRSTFAAYRFRRQTPASVNMGHEEAFSRSAFLPA
jgi:hypothetical protein